jgi:hypothetical protein
MCDEERTMRACLLYWTVIAACISSSLCLAANSDSPQLHQPLRWKFEVGEKLNYNMTQDMDMGIGDGQNVAKMHQEMDMIWDVQGVDQATGEAVINQKFDRLRLQVTSPKGNLDFDSKSDKTPTGLEALIAPLYKAITQGEFELTITARGEIKNAKIPNDVLSVLKTSPGAAALGEYATEEGFKKMILKSAFVLPEDAPKKGETSKTSVEMNNQAGDKQIVETSYTYEGTKDLDGSTFALFKPQLTMKFEGEKKPGKPSITQQSSDGEVLFNIAKGRLRSMKLDQHVTIDPNLGNQSPPQQIEQRIDIEVSPRVEKPNNIDTKTPDSSDPKAKD